MSSDFCSHCSYSQLPLGMHVAQTCLAGLRATTGPEAHGPTAPKPQKAPSVQPQNSPPLPALPSVCRLHFLTGEFQTHSLGQHYLLHHPPPLALAHQLCQPVPATIAQPGGWRGLNEHPRASCGRWLIKMGVGEGRVWHVRSQVQSQTFFFSIPNS